MKLIRLLLVLLLCATALHAQPRLALLGSPPQNGFIPVAEELGLKLEATVAPFPADYAALLICAPQYPTVAPLSEPAREAMQGFLEAGKAVYIEYTPLPGLIGDTPDTARFERLYLPTDALSTDLPPLSLFEEHSSRYLPLTVSDGEVLLAYGRLAGMDRAAFGPPETSIPALVSMPQGKGRLLVAATALSNWQRGRYRPTKSWEALTRAVLLALLPEADARRARENFLEVEAWTEPRVWAAPDQKVRLCVRVAPGVESTATGPAGKPKLTATEAGLLSTTPALLPKGTYTWTVTAAKGKATRALKVNVEIGERSERYRETVSRNLKWFEQASMLIAPDGSLGVREGFTSNIGADGKPATASCPRVDCISECALLFAIYGRLQGDKLWFNRGQRMLQHTGRAFSISSPNTWYFGHWQSRGEFRDDGSTLYVFNDDSGAGTLFSLLGYAENGDPALLKAGLRGVEYFCHVASEKSGLFGYMPHRDYENSGHTGVAWPTLRAQEIKSASPHVMNLPLASLLVAYQLTGEKRYLEIAERGCRTLMAMYPNWHLQTSRSCEHARMLLPLSLLQHVAPSAEHRQWLATVADYLIGKQDPCGAIREWDGYNPKNNVSFGTAETSVFQENGDPISDQLYNTGFALMHLALAARVTGDERYRAAAERLGDYLTRIQIRDGSEYDGTWLRAFDFARWEYFGSSADIGWGPYCSETGWMCAPLDLGLLMLADDRALTMPDRSLGRSVATDAAKAARAEADAVEQALSQPPGAMGQAKTEPSRGPYAALAWPTATPQTLTYSVYRSTADDCPATEANLVGTTMDGRWVDMGLEPQTQYYYRVVPTNGLGQAGAGSGVVSVKSGPVSKARGCRYTKSLVTHSGYTDIGDKASTDGVYAEAYRDRKSYGYRLAEVGEKIELAVTVDLGAAQRIGRVSHHNCGASGYGPDVMAVSISTDGEAFTSVGSSDVTTGDLIALDFAEVSARYVRFDFTKQRQGATDDWLFIDELEVF
ncbi:MAG: galactose-binding domain-containing protein [Armatimonadota bacterium]